MYLTVIGYVWRDCGTKLLRYTTKVRMMRYFCPCAFECRPTCAAPFHARLALPYGMAIQKDTNGDGYSDVIISAYGADEAYVFYGAPSFSSTVYELAALSGANGFVISTGNDGDVVVVAGAGVRLKWTGGKQRQLTGVNNQSQIQKYIFFLCRRDVCCSRTSPTSKRKITNHNFPLPHTVLAC